MCIRDRLGRAYNNNDKPEEAIKVLNSIDEEYRDAVWYYRCAYSYGAIVSNNHEVYTSNNMQHMLALVDNGIRLAVSENRNNITGYFFEIIDMCYMQIDFERCESDYPELCSAYSKYVAEKQKNRRGVSQHRTITAVSYTHLILDFTETVVSKKLIFKPFISCLLYTS